MEQLIEILYFSELCSAQQFENSEIRPCCQFLFVNSISWRYNKSNSNIVEFQL